MPDSLSRSAAAGVPEPGSDWARAQSFPVPGAAKGSWCLIRTATADGGRNVRHMLTFRNAGGDSVGARPFFRRTAAGTYRTIAYVPGDADTFQLFLFSPDRGIVPAPLHFRPVSRATSALLLLAARPQAAPRLLRLAAGGQLRRVRTLLNALAGAVTTPTDYGEWIELFDTWPAEPPAAAHGASVAALVLQHGAASASALAATVASLEGQGRPTPHAVLTGPADWRAAAAALPGDYLLLLQAGEVLPTHATWFAGSELRRLGHPAFAWADEDRLDRDGHRSAPVFRPEPGPVMMLSGTQTRGAWFVRRDMLALPIDVPEPGWAECLRLALWLGARDAGTADARRIPMVLCHRRDDAEAAPGTALAALVNAHLRRTGLPLAASPTLPVLLHRAPDAPPPRPVSILVPSTLRNPLALRCLLSVLRGTDHPALELLVGVSQPGPLDPVQAEAARQLTADPRARIIHIQRPSFNFSAVCNALARDTASELILLLNDDVSTIDPGWLGELDAFLADPEVGLVGARLLYPDGSVQHGGVIVGLAGLCDHLNRNLPGTDPGPAGRAVVAQELSAVTAACLLVRRTVFEAAGGLDENYPSAFNDVDFCLRVREAGHRVVFAPAATLTHHEMATYGSHYAGDRAPFEAEEISRMQRRWAGVVANDPFHSPNLDLGTGREWQLAFPPRRPRQFQL